MAFTLAEINEVLKSGLKAKGYVLVLREASFSLKRGQ